MKYKYLEHTADAKMQAWGDTLEEAFENVAYATFNLLVDPCKVKSKIKKAVEVKAKRQESLLYDFIEELIYFLSVDGFLLSKMEDMKIIKENEGFSLTAQALGDSFKHYEVMGDIKAATYNDMFIKKENDKYLIQFVVDI